MPFQNPDMQAFITKTVPRMSICVSKSGSQKSEEVSPNGRGFERITPAIEGGHLVGRVNH
jgi:hypothetical protein